MRVSIKPHFWTGKKVGWHYLILIICTVRVSGARSRSPQRCPSPSGNYPRTCPPTSRHNTSCLQSLGALSLSLLERTPTGQLCPCLTGDPPMGQGGPVPLLLKNMQIHLNYRIGIKKFGKPSVNAGPQNKIGPGSPM